MEAIAGTGVWAASLRYGDPGSSAEAAAELQSLGYSTTWIPDIGGDVFAAVENLLQATRTLTIATGILNIWMHTPEETAGATRPTHRGIRRSLPGRPRSQPCPTHRSGGGRSIRQADWRR